MVRRLSFTAAPLAVLYGSWQIAGATYAAGYGWATHAATTACVATAIGLPVVVVTALALDHSPRARRLLRPKAPKPTPVPAPVPVIHAVITSVPAVTR